MSPLYYKQVFKECKEKDDNATSVNPKSKLIIIIRYIMLKNSNKI